MSATNRGRVRRAYDFYETPEEVTREFLFEYFEGDFHVILEPCAGSGKMVKVLRDRFPLAWIEANDIQDGSPIPYVVRFNPRKRESIPQNFYHFATTSAGFQYYVKVALEILE